MAEHKSDLELNPEKCYLCRKWTRLRKSPCEGSCAEDGLICLEDFGCERFEPLLGYQTAKGDE